MKEQKNALEWTVFAVSCALIVGTVAVLARDASTTSDAPATFRVEVRTTAADDGPLLRVRVRNDGATSAEHVRVEVLADPDVREWFEVELLPRSSSRDGYVKLPPGAANPRARVVAWTAP